MHYQGDSSEPAICLVDLNGIFTRTWFGCKEHRGDTVSKMRGWYELFESEFSTTYICLDSPPYFRKELYPNYKGQRRKRSEGIKECLQDVVREASVWFSVKYAEGCEADDVIMTLCHTHRVYDGEVWVYSPDKDLLQTLVYENVIVYNPHTRSETTYSDFLLDYGFPPCEFAEYQALMGDSADNIPGIRGIGPKKAQKIIIDGVRIEDEKSVKELELSRKLVTLKHDAKLQEWSYDRSSRHEQARSGVGKEHAPVQGSSVLESRQDAGGCGSGEGAEDK